MTDKLVDKNKDSDLLSKKNTGDVKELENDLNVDKGMTNLSVKIGSKSAEGKDVSGDTLKISGNGSIGGDLSIVGDLNIGDHDYSLKINVPTSGAEAGDVRIRADGGTNRLMLGGGNEDTLTIKDGNVGIGTTDPKWDLDVSAKTIKVGLEKNGGGQLIIKNNPPQHDVPEDAIYIEAFDSKCSKSAKALFITGPDASFNIQELHLNADKTVFNSIKDKPGKLEVNGNIAINGLIDQEDWKEPTSLRDNWKNYSDEYNHVGYFLDKNRIVHLKGLLKYEGQLGSETTIFILDEGYRPAVRELHIAATYDTRTHGLIAARCDILPNGEVVAVTGDPNWYCLDGITFRIK